VINYFIEKYGLKKYKVVGLDGKAKNEFYVSPVEGAKNRLRPGSKWRTACYLVIEELGAQGEKFATDRVYEIWRFGSWGSLIEKKCI